MKIAAAILSVLMLAGLTFVAAAASSMDVTISYIQY